MACVTGFLLFFFFITPAFTANKLRNHFYKSSCPAAEELVRQTVQDYYLADHAIAAGVIRLFFHDCFVRGCDGSILLDMSPYSDKAAEKSSPANIGLYGEDVIDAAKFQLENICPETVSCADIVAFAARDAAVIAGIPFYSVPSGRRDGIVSLAEEVRSNLPAFFFDATKQTKYFKNKGFSQEEMVVLVGAHSLGGAHCSSFAYRLYNFSDGRIQDPSIEPSYAQFLKLRCPAPKGVMAGALYPNRKVDFGGESAMKLDGSYYSLLKQGMGLLESDQTLMKDTKTRRLVRKMNKHPRRWAEKFALAMIKLGKLDVLTGDQGEVRKTCRIVNKRGD
ncbi:hypothetical protein M5K25_010017 [Dendrobium thyrsiflorum]|uniref:Peroxidase n=1 Tax=Dendrobium thyrsiflorum TaxID=117978 RepID=A0ABD0V7A9_DENTH